MFVFDTDTLTHFLMGHERVVKKTAQVDEEVVLTIITRIEVLQGRFAAILKAEDGEKLPIAQQRLVATEQDLDQFIVLTLDASAGPEFDRLRKNQKLKIGRADLLIAAITPANRATLVTRNEKDYRKIPGLKVENWVD